MPERRTANVVAALALALADELEAATERRRGGRGTRRRPSVGWESLTPAELKVVRLITQGLTYREVANALYLSKRTVETHATHIFRKLGISTRHELQEIRNGANGATA